MPIDPSCQGQEATVLIADDHAPSLQTACEVMSTHFKVVGAAKDGVEALDLAAKTNPSLVVLDINMPNLDGFGTAKELARRGSPSRIVYLTAEDDDDYVSEALRIGAQGYVVKRRLHADLLPALNLAVDGSFFISPYAFAGIRKPETNRHVLHFYSSDARFFQRAAELTCDALNDNELVFMLLSKDGIAFVREELQARGLDYAAAIERGQYCVLSVENNLSFAPDHDSSTELTDFEGMLRGCLKRAVARSRTSGQRLTVFSDVVPTLVREGHTYEIAARVEAVWNSLISTETCAVYCGCPVVHLGTRAGRETLSKVCCEHSDVVSVG